MNMTLPWRSERLTIRKVELTDAELIYALKTCLKVRKYQGGIINTTLENERNFIEQGRTPTFVIEISSSNTPIGQCGYFRNEKSGGMDVLVEILPCHHKSSYGREVLSLLAERWETDDQDGPLRITTEPDNELAQKLLLACGFEFQGEYDAIEGFGFKKCIYGRPKNA